MLENLTNEEIEELLDTGSLYLDRDKQIEKEPAYDTRGDVIGSYYQYRRGFGDISRPYKKLSDLLLCEYLSFDDIRANWKYHGILLDNPKFQEKLK